MSKKILPPYTTDKTEVARQIELYATGMPSDFIGPRTKLRYMAALYPDLDINSLARELHAFIGSERVEVSDIKLIIQGRHLYNTNIILNEVPIVTIQAVGRCLSNNMSCSDIERQLRVSRETVSKINSYVGIRNAQQLFNDIVEDAKKGTSIGRIMSEYGLSHTKAQKLLSRARLLLTKEMQ